MLTQTVASPATLLSGLPSGREIHSIKPYVMPELSKHVLEGMRALPDRTDDFGGDPLSSDDEVSVGQFPGTFPGTQEDYRSESARSYY